MDRRLVKHSYAIEDIYCIFFLNYVVLRQMDRLMDKHPDAFNIFIE